MHLFVLDVSCLLDFQASLSGAHLVRLKRQNSEHSNTKNSRRPCTTLSRKFQARVEPLITPVSTNV